MSKTSGIDEGGDTDRLAVEAVAAAEADMSGVEVIFELMRAKGSAAGRDPTGGSWAGTGAVAPEAFAEEDEARITAAAAAALGAAADGPAGPSVGAGTPVVASSPVPPAWAAAMRASRCAISC